MRPDARKTGLGVVCQRCSAEFFVRPSLKGGIASCPECGRATPVPGGAEPAFWVVLGVAIVVFGSIGLALWLFAGQTAGLIALAVGAVIITIATIAS